MSDWRPIEDYKAVCKSAFTQFVWVCHAERKWLRMGRYDNMGKRWLYSGTNERSQYAQVEGDDPTHFMPLPALPAA